MRLLFGTLIISVLLIFLLTLKVGSLVVKESSKIELPATISPTVAKFSPTPSPSMKAQITTYQRKSISPAPKTDNSQKYGETIKVDNETSVSKFAADAYMSTSSELHQAMNTYRSAHGLPSLNEDPTLCNIAQTRAHQLVEAGKLDYHAGFEPLARSQHSFNNLSEVIFGGFNKVSGTHIVEWGWAQSLTGHKEAISNPKWHHGCASVEGLFAVYIFGAN